MGFSPTQGGGKHRLTLSSLGDTEALSSHIPQWSVAEGGQKPGVLAPFSHPGPSIPFQAAVSSRCFRFCTVSQSGQEKREGKRKGSSGAPTPFYLPSGDCTLGYIMWEVPKRWEMGRVLGKSKGSSLLRVKEGT